MTKKLPRVLILLAAYNGSSYIREQITSILAQRDVDIEILLSDDASGDHTAEIARQMDPEEKYIRLSAREQSSGSAAANFRYLIDMADIAGFDYVAFADQDDVWYDDKLMRACRALEDLQHGAYSCAVDVGTGTIASLDQAAVLTRADFLYEGAGQGCTFVMSAAFFRRIQSFVRLHPSELKDFHFHDWMVYVLSRAWNVAWYFDERPGMWYRQHGANEIGARRGWNSVKKRGKLIVDGWYRRQVLLAASVYQLAGGNEPGAIRMTRLLRSRPALRRNLALSWAALFDSRRRLTDRLIISVSALAGYV